tara:strand:- start:555 stop:758 length:204 start_codon:yes stop_codon:yes gene_type:complete
MTKLQHIIKCLSEVRENIGSGLFLVDEETMDELIESGARDYELDELEIAVDDAIECLKVLDKLRSKV